MIPLSSLPQRRFAVMGLGLSGRATALALLAAGKEVRAWDDRESARTAAAAAGVPIADLASGGLEGCDALLLSPGVPHTYPKPHPAAAAARAAGTPIIGDVELLFQAEPKARFVGITGTNGKSTTTALLGHILARAGVRCEVGGNLGTPVLSFAPVGSEGVYVIEMSSYQLELTPSLAFDAAALINLTPDHLDRHGGFDGYVAAKRRIFGGGDGTCVVGVDDESCRAIARGLANSGRRLIEVSATDRVRGVTCVDGLLIDARDPARPVEIVDVGAAAALPGSHNRQNAAIAGALALAFGLAPAVVAAAILDFPGLAHRQERITVKGGVAFVNDSKATNAEAAAKALACYDAIYWIAGGRPKDGGLDPIYPYLPKVRRAFLIGEAEARFAAELAGRAPLTRVGALGPAVEQAYAQARAEGLPGATVLLSPACASFDQFANFEARGDAFRALVEGLS